MIRREIDTTPPTTAPTMTSVFELLEEVGFTVGEDWPKCEVEAPLLVLDAEMVAVEVPSFAPGVGSGKSRKRDVRQILIVRER